MCTGCQISIRNGPVQKLGQGSKTECSESASHTYLSRCLGSFRKSLQCDNQI